MGPTPHSHPAATSEYWDQPRTQANCGRGGDRGRREAKDINALIGLLAPEATAIADSGGLAKAHLLPIEGSEQIARVYVDVASMAPNLTILERTVNGQPGLVAQLDGVTVTVYAFEVAGDRIKRIWTMRNPEKLRIWTTG